MAGAAVDRGFDNFTDPLRGTIALADHIGHLGRCEGFMCEVSESRILLGVIDIQNPKELIADSWDSALTCGAKDGDEAL